MVYQPKNHKIPKEPPLTGPEATRVFDRRAPRGMAFLTVIILFLVLAAWRIGPPATHGVPLLLFLLTFHWIDLGWLRARYGPLSKFVHVGLIWMSIPVEAGDLPPHSANARRLLPAYLGLWLGVLPGLSSWIWLVEGLGWVLLALALFESVTGKPLPPLRKSRPGAKKNGRPEDRPFR